MLQLETAEKSSSPTLLEVDLKKIHNTNPSFITYENLHNFGGDRVLQCRMKVYFIDIIYHYLLSSHGNDVFNKAVSKKYPLEEDGLSDTGAFIMLLWDFCNSSKMYRESLLDEIMCSCENEVHFVYELSLPKDFKTAAYHILRNFESHIFLEEVLHVLYYMYIYEGGEPLRHTGSCSKYYYYYPTYYMNPRINPNDFLFGEVSSTKELDKPENKVGFIQFNSETDNLTSKSLEEHFNYKKKDYTPADFYTSSKLVKKLPVMGSLPKDFI